MKNKKKIIIGAVIILLLPLTFTLTTDFIRNLKKNDSKEANVRLTDKQIVESSIIIKNKQNVLYNDVNKILVVDLRQGTDNDSTKLAAKSDVHEVLLKAKRNIDKIEEVVISFKTNLSNNKGEVANLDVLRFKYDKDRIDNINEGTNVQVLDRIATEYFEHTVLN